MFRSPFLRVAALALVATLGFSAACTSSEPPLPEGLSLDQEICASETDGEVYDSERRVGVAVQFGVATPNEVLGDWNNLSQQANGELPSLPIDGPAVQSQAESGALRIDLNDDTVVWFSAASNGTVDGLALWSAAYGDRTEGFSLALQHMLILADPISDYDRQVGSCVFDVTFPVALSLQTVAGVSYRADWDRIDPDHPDLVLTIVPSEGFPEVDSDAHRRLAAEISDAIAAGP